MGGVNVEKIDPKLAQAVWARVLRANRPQPPIPPRPPMPPTPPRPEEPSREELRQWMAEILARVRGYRSVNAGRNTALLRRMATEEEGHRRQLAALYFLLYGRRPEVLSGAAPGKRSAASALRDLYGAEQRAVRQWREAARQYPTHAALFTQFARDDRRHAEQLRRILASKM